MAILSVKESLRGRLDTILAPLRSPGGLPPAFTLAEWEAEQGITLRLLGPRGSLTIELEARDLDRPAYASTQRFNVYYSTLKQRSAELDAGERAALDRVVEVLRAREGALPVLSSPGAPSAASTAQAPRVVIREVAVERGLMDEGDGAFYLNPYVGCMLACPFCYAIHRADFSRSLEGAPLAPWGRWVDVKIDLPEVVAREARALSEGMNDRGERAHVRMSPIVTDPYQPIERHYRVTRRCLEALVGTALIPVVLTRSSSVLEDADLLLALHGLVGMSVTTDDDAVRAAFEPSTESIDARIAALGALRARGLTTFAVVQPMLPMDPDRLVGLLAPQVQAVRIGPLYEKHRAEEIATRLGRRELLDPAWERATFARLKAGFEARGVLVNPEGPPWSAFLR